MLAHSPCAYLRVPRCVVYPAPPPRFHRYTSSDRCVVGIYQPGSRPLLYPLWSDTLRRLHTLSLYLSPSRARYRPLSRPLAFPPVTRGNVRVVEIDGPVVRLELEGACGSCPSSTMTMKMGLERRLVQRIPEISEVVQSIPNGPELNVRQRLDRIDPPRSTCLFFPAPLG